MIERVIAAFQELKLNDEEIADILWLGIQMRNLGTFTESVSQKNDVEQTQQLLNREKTENIEAPESQPVEENKLNLYPQISGSNEQNLADGTYVKVDSATALRKKLALGRAFKPFKRRFLSSKEFILDEAATINGIVENRIAKKNLFIPVMQPNPERWFKVVLVVDEGSSMTLWKQTIKEFQRLLEGHGAFQDVRSWGLITNNSDKVYLRQKAGNRQKFHHPKELIDANERCLFLIVTDCVAPAWYSGEVVKTLSIWAGKSPVVIVQVLPEWLWERSALGMAEFVWLQSLTPGVANEKLQVTSVGLLDDSDTSKKLKVPVVSFEPESIKNWASMVVGTPDIQAKGFLLTPNPAIIQNHTEIKLSPQQRFQRFRQSTSPMGRRLAGLLAATPVTLPIARILQEKILSTSTQVHLAEVFLGGILKSTNSHHDCDKVLYEFIDGTRNLFLDTLPLGKSQEVLEEISEHISQRAGFSNVNEFFAFLKNPNPRELSKSFERSLIQPFAQVTVEVLKRFGSQYTSLIEQLERNWAQGSIGSLLSTLEFNTFQFDVVTVNAKGEEIKREKGTAQYFTEYLNENVTLEMVAIPGGTFLMGSPETEKGHDESESPQHEVTVQPFFMGKYPVTQAQWQAVAAFEQVERELDPDPSRFKGDNLPVERISWYDAKEFCDRISKKTGKSYQLPSEAQWEYACRAGTTTPFHFGETITSALANYDGTEIYASERKGEDRERTTDVGSFKVANAFGLFDMHGNVWEWCADDWHQNYQDTLELVNDNKKLLRGGSWNHYPVSCRAANRYRYNPDYDNNYDGFRVVCFVAPRTY